MSGSPAEGNAGLYRAETDEVLAGFVVANDGSDRGGMGINSISVARSAFNPTSPIVLQPEVGEIEFQHITTR